MPRKRLHGTSSENDRENSRYPEPYKLYFYRKPTPQSFSRATSTPLDSEYDFLKTIGCDGFGRVAQLRERGTGRLVSTRVSTGLKPFVCANGDVVTVERDVCLYRGNDDDGNVTPGRTTPVRTTPVRTTPVRTTPVRTTPIPRTPPYTSGGASYHAASAAASSSSAAASSDDADDCVICMDTIKNVKTLSCGHQFCKECIDTAFDVKKVCPVCQKVYGVMSGHQPNGTMHSHTDYAKSLPGYPGVGTIVINYDIPDGTQGPNHPNPGVPFRGIRRTAYLPDTADGRKVQRLLKKAFDQKLVFTIGRSTTSGRDNIVTWNDIHHKTSDGGGSFGYPDPTYLQRVLSELAAKGLTE